MPKPRSLYTKVASGPCRGGQWALYWPAWKWARLTADEQAAVIARQQQLMKVEQRPNGRKQNATMEATDDTNNRKR